MNSDINSKRVGTILNLLFAINWIFLTIVFIRLKKTATFLSGGLLILSYLVPLITIFLFAGYIWINYKIIKQYEDETKKIAKKYVVVISCLAITAILSTLLILLAQQEKLVIWAAILSLSISGIFGITAIVVDTRFFINRLKWNMLRKKEKSTELLEKVV